MYMTTLLHEANIQAGPTVSILLSYTLYHNIYIPYSVHVCVMIFMFYINYTMYHIVNNTQWAIITNGIVVELWILMIA